MFRILLEKMNEVATLSFDEASEEIEQYINDCEGFLGILEQIGTIPESIEHDSTQEKLFAKASDAALARAFRMLGLRATVLKERGDSADVQAESMYHNYTLVADAKAFRLSRTAKNQKDFKVTALSGWRKDADFAVLCGPYFQYPVSRSQIYAQAVDHNVCLFSWENIVFLIKNNIQETEDRNLSVLWNISAEYAQHCVVAEKKNCFISVINQAVLNVCQKEQDDLSRFLMDCKGSISARAAEETAFWVEERQRIAAYTREQAIAELVKAKKIDEKIAQINKYVLGIRI